MASATSPISSKFQLSPPLLLLLLFIFLFELFSVASLASPAGSDGRGRDLLVYTGASQRRRASSSQGANCRELRTMEECEKYMQQCRWCTSEALDDMCFSTHEAWRLPSQVFSCPRIRRTS